MAIAFVQNNHVQAFSPNVTSMPVTLTAVGAGNAIVGIASTDDNGAGTFTGVTDNVTGNTYTILSNIGLGGRRTITFVGGNIQNGPTQINIGLNASIGNYVADICEYSGTLVATNPVDNSGASFTGQTQATPGTGTDGLTSGPVTTSVNGCLIWGGTSHIAGSSVNGVSGTGFTLRSTTTVWNATEDKSQTTAGSVSSTFTATLSDANATFLVALAPAGGGGGGSTFPQILVLGVG